MFKLFILANVFLAIGLLMNYALPPLISRMIDKKIALAQDSQTFPLWKDPPMPIYQKFYFYNVTNVHEIEVFGHKPQLVEVGPFTYRTEMSRRDIEFKSRDGDEGNLETLVRYKNFKTWHFEPDLSIADQSFELVTLNAPLAITLSLIQSASNAVRLLVTISLDGLSDGFFTRRSIKQLLFDGYPDLLTTFGPLLNAEMLSQGGHFGYMNARNNSLDGIYEVNTGVDDIGKLNTISKYNGRSKLPYWHDSHCNSLEGATTGEMYPKAANNDGGPEQRSSIKLFQPDFCRVWRLDSEPSDEFDSPSTKLRLKRFRATRDIFKNSTDLPENSCFFGHHLAGGLRHHHRPIGASHAGNRANLRQHRQLSGESLARQAHQPRPRPGLKVRHEWPRGVFSLAPCKFNAPIYMSMPHFLDADPYFLAQVGGLKPDPAEHEFYADLEPRTGSPVKLRARVQLNVAISKPPGLVRFRNVPEIMFPVFWQELSLDLSPSGPVLGQLHLAARGAQEINLRISYALLLVGIVILITTGLLYLHNRFISGRLELDEKAAAAAAAAGAAEPSSGFVRPRATSAPTAVATLERAATAPAATTTTTTSGDQKAE